MIPLCRIMSHLLFYELPARGIGQVGSIQKVIPWALGQQWTLDVMAMQRLSKWVASIPLRELPVFVVAYVVASGEKPYLRSLISRILLLAHVDMEHFNRIVRSR